MNIYKIYIQLSLCVLFWSGNFILGRYIKADIEPLELAFFRWLFVFLFCLPIFYFVDFKKLINIFLKNSSIMIVLSILGITLFNTILYFALQTTTATNALLINSITPIIIVIFSFFILKYKLDKIQLLGIVLSTIGVIYLVSKGDIKVLISFDFHLGDFLIILSSITWALYSVLLKFKPKELNHIELFISFVIIGFIFLLPLYLFQGYSIQREIGIIRDYWYFFIYVSFFASILSFYFWNNGVKEIGAEKTGQFTHLMPVFGTILAFIFLGETLKYFHFIGIAFIAIGIYTALFIKRRV